MRILICIWTPDSSRRPLRRHDKAASFVCIDGRNTSCGAVADSGLGLSRRGNLV